MPLGILHAQDNMVKQGNILEQELVKISQCCTQLPGEDDMQYSHKMAVWEDLQKSRMDQAAENPKGERSPFECNQF